MTIDQLKQGIVIFRKLQTAQRVLEETIKTIETIRTGDTTVSFKGILITLPLNTVRGELQQRKNQLESEISDLESQLNML